MKTSKKFHRRKRLWLIPTVIIGSAILAVLIVGQFTPFLNALIIRQLSSLQSNSPTPGFDSVQENVTVVRDIAYDDKIENSVMDIYYPKNAQGPIPVVMWLHGGGYILGDKEMTKEYGMIIANGGYVVANVNYALAPEQMYPTPVIQSNHALKYLNENIAKYGGDKNRLLIGGNSAGAQLASQLAALMSNEKLVDTMGIALLSRMNS